MNIDPEQLRPLLAQVVAEALAPMTRLAFTEPEAASLIGVRSHVLRDARLRGEIRPTKLGGRIGYDRAELMAYLERNKA